MEWLTAVGLPVAAILGGLVGAWWAKRSSKTAEIGSLLNAQLEVLYSEHPRQRQAARDIIRGLMESGSLSREQLEAASTALKHWAAVNWDAADSDAAYRDAADRDAADRDAADRDAADRAGRTLESADSTAAKEGPDD